MAAVRFLSVRWPTVAGREADEIKKPRSESWSRCLPAAHDWSFVTTPESMRAHGLRACGRRGDFRAFGKRLTWVKLADRCIARLATDLLELRDVKSVREDADLL